MSRSQHRNCSVGMYASCHQRGPTGSQPEIAPGAHTQFCVWLSLFDRRDQRLHHDSRPIAGRSGTASHQREDRECGAGERFCRRLFTTWPFALRRSMLTRTRRSSGTHALRSCARTNRTSYQERFLIPAPQHRDGSGQTSAHVEGEITFRVWNLPLTSLFCEMLISFDHLPDPGRSDWMTIAD